MVFMHDTVSHNTYRVAQLGSFVPKDKAQACTHMLKSTLKLNFKPNVIELLNFELSVCIPSALHLRTMVPICIDKGCQPSQIPLVSPGIGLVYTYPGLIPNCSGTWCKYPLHQMTCANFY